MKNQEHNLKGLWSIQFIIESLMMNKIDKDENIPSIIIDDLARLHSNIVIFTNQDQREYK